MINFIVSIPGIKDAQIAGKIVRLEASMRVFSEEISTLIGRLSNKGLPSAVWVGISCLFRAPRNRKAEQSEPFHPTALWHRPSPAQRHRRSWSGSL